MCTFLWLFLSQLYCFFCAHIVIFNIMKYATDQEIQKIIQGHRKGMTTPEITADLGLPVDEKNVAWVKGQIHRFMGSFLQPKRLTIKEIKKKFLATHADGPMEKIPQEEPQGFVSGTIDHSPQGKRKPGAGSKKGCPSGYTRYTVIIREETVERLGRIARKAGGISKCADAALTEYLDKITLRS
jgi:hypothetical protein